LLTIANHRGEKKKELILSANGQNKLINWWKKTPLYFRIIYAVITGLVIGVVLGSNAAPLAIPARLILRALSALAPPLILFAIIQSLVHAELTNVNAVKIIKLLLLNTIVAITIGIFVANIILPGKWGHITLLNTGEKITMKIDPLSQFLDNVPKSIAGPFTDDGKVIGVILIALAAGIALRRFKNYQLNNIQDFLYICLNSLTTILSWILELIPFAVFGVVASIVGANGFSNFIPIGGFITAVMIALLFQALYYLTRIYFGSWVSPIKLLQGVRDALFMAFSTSSSTATMPVTFACLRNNIKLRESSASMGALVGSNFNNDGTALYEAMSALFIAQILDLHLNLSQQFIIAITSIAASVGAAGIPEAGLVTMTMVFSAVGLPTEYIAVLLTVDWFLDRCRTVINVMGDITVSCLLDGSTQESIEN
jgi:Na+/H+-dicarboxylate symporter